MIYITAILKLLAIFISIWAERSKDRKEAKKKARTMIAEGIKDRDPAKITAAFDRIRTL